MQEMDFWHESCVRLKDDRAVVKLYHEDGTFKTSIVVPTEYYPLSSGSVPYEVFHYKNTEPVTDEAVLNIFDDCTYKIGFAIRIPKGLLQSYKRLDMMQKPIVVGCSHQRGKSRCIIVGAYWTESTSLIWPMIIPSC